MPQRKKRKDQDVVDLADRIRKELGDARPKSFGLYVKLIKEFGKARVERAFWQAVKRPARDKIRYFLGIMSNIRKRRANLKVYHALRKDLLKKVTMKHTALYTNEKRQRFRTFRRRHKHL